MIVRPATILFATTASKLATSPVTVQNHATPLLLALVLVVKRIASAIAAINLAIWLKIVPPKAPLLAKSATNVAVWVTSPATALRVLVVWEAACVAAMVVVTEEEAMVEDSAKVLSSATPAAASATCRATALKVKSATTVSRPLPKALTFLLRQLTLVYRRRIWSSLQGLQHS